MGVLKIFNFMRLFNLFFIGSSHPEFICELPGEPN